MKFAHISDLHLGFVLNGYSMCEDQEYIMNKIADIIKKDESDAVFISGDIYDKPLPPEEAVRIFDDFLSKICEGDRKVFIIPGNHDSAERLSFASNLLKKGNVFVAKPFLGRAETYKMQDEYGDIYIHLIPFIKPVNVRRIFGDDEAIGTDYTAAFDLVVKNSDIDFSKRNILLSHQFVNGAERADSTEVMVGGLDYISSFVYDGFDYVAMGHLHKGHFIKRKTLRYCGTPLKYSRNESENIKSVTLGQIRQKGDVDLKIEPLKPLRDLRKLKGAFDELIKEKTNDYVFVTLTDETKVVDALSRLRTVMPNIMSIDYEKSESNKLEFAPSIIDRKTPLEIFEDFYMRQNSKTLSDEEKKIVTEVICEVF